MKIQNIFNFGLILLISAALILSGCQKSEDSSTSTGESGGGSSDPVSEVVTALQGAVKTFGSSSSSRSAASTGNSISIDKPVKSLVSLYLMLDDNYQYPVAKVKSAEDGSYTITTNDVKTFLLDTSTHDKIKNDYGFTMPSAVTSLSSSPSGSALNTAFESLGPLRIRAMYKSGDKILAMTSMADPKEDTVELNPVLARASEQIMGALVETIKSTINSISSPIFTDELKSKMISSVLASVTKSVNETLLKLSLIHI